MSEERSIRVFIVEDHKLFREGLRELLEARGFDVVGTAPDGETGAWEVARARPDVVMMDVNMPGISGIEATRRLTQSAPDSSVVMLTVTADENDVIEAILAGAAGYVLKDADEEEIVAAIRAAAEGESVLSSRVTGGVVERVRLARGAGGSAGQQLDKLSEREHEVLALLVEGKDNGEIAEALFISTQTVKSHVSSVLSKLGVANRLQAAVEAVRRGLA